jgi:hypothetical protein
MGQSLTRTLYQDDYNNDGILEEELVDYVGQKDGGFLRFHTPPWPAPSTKVIMKFPGLTYDRPPSFPLNLNQVFFWSKPPINSTCACYEVTLAPNQTYSISQSSFVWPIFNIDAPPTTTPFFYSTRQTLVHYNLHRLSFGDFKPREVAFTFDVTVGRIVPGTTLFGCFSGTSLIGADQWSQPSGHGHGSYAVVLPNVSETYSEIVGPTPPNGACNEVAPTFLGLPPPSPGNYAGTIVTRIHAPPGTYNVVVKVDMKAGGTGQGSAATVNLNWSGSPTLPPVVGTGGTSNFTYAVTQTRTITVDASGVATIVIYRPVTAINNQNTTSWAKGRIRIMNAQCLDAE